MESEKLSGYQKAFLILGIIVIFFIIGKKMADHSRAQSAELAVRIDTLDKGVDKARVKVTVLASKYESKLAHGYIVSCEGNPVDKDHQAVSDELLVSATKMSSARFGDDTVLIRIKAFSDTAKKEISKSNSNVILPELVYESIQIVAKRVVDLRMAKDTKEFIPLLKKYKKSISARNDYVALHGYQILEESYTFEGGTVFIK